MKDLVLEQIRSLAGTLAALHGRVREAVAGEVGKAVAEAVGEVLVTALAGRPPARPGRAGAYDPYAAYRAGGYGPDAWDDDPPAWEGEDPRARRRTRPEAPDTPAPDPATAPAALALGMTAGRWWLARQGGRWGAAGVGLAVAGTLLAGGPTARTLLGVLWAAHRLLAATDALGDSAKALGRV